MLENISIKSMVSRYYICTETLKWLVLFAVESVNRIKMVLVFKVSMARPGTK